mmetsp:Transcript_46711/g.135173  ORF Transcript_46711/g.135173 Transcript_46711/m.135173 type:complete len:684 (-) Transcript_46711:115-2166(-)
MAPVLPSTTALRALLAFLPLLMASAMHPLSNSSEETAEEDAVCLMQSRVSLMPVPRQVLIEAAAGDFDASFFAQTAVEVSSAETVEEMSSAESLEEAPAAGEQPSWLPAVNVDQPPEDEDMTCSLEGLTPGVCAMKTLARVEVSPNRSSDLDFVNPERLERALFQEIEAALAGTHNGFSADHLQLVEEELGAIFAALPKNEAGLLDHNTVRYAVHQRFLRKHAWYIRNLNPVGEAQTPASAGEAMRGQVPEHLQRLIEKRQDGRGLGLRELSALTTTLEHLINGDIAERLKAVYGAHGLVHNQPVSRSEVLELMKTYMAHFLSLRHRSGYAVTPEQAREERRDIESTYPGWKGVVALMEEALVSRAPQNPSMMLPFSEALSAANEVMEKFEQSSAQECRDMKDELGAMPNGATGRVLLTDLHRKALDGEMQFAESTEYLAVLGALETNDRGAVGVLVPNYVYSPSNCLGTTSFFDMCCPNECEVIMEELEMRLRKPSATPAEVSAAIDVIRTEGPLSEASLQELERLAGARGGGLALHGHGFAAWLHGAFPRECPRPGAEDFAGARHEAEVPAAQHEYQAVAKLPSIVASKSDLIAELEEEERQEAPDPKVFGGNGVDLDIDQLKALAADKLGLKGLKVASLFDASSLAQTSLDATPAAAGAEESASVEETPGTSGLNIRQEV